MRTNSSVGTNRLANGADLSKRGRQAARSKAVPTDHFCMYVHHALMVR